MISEELITQIQNESKATEATKAATAEETTILNFIDWFRDKENGSYATYDDAVKLIESNKNPDTWLEIKADLKKRATADNDSKYTTGIDIDLAKNTIFDIRKKVSLDDFDLAKNLNRTGIIDNYKQIEKYLESDDIFKIEGINPDEGAPNDARISMSFAGMGGNNEKAIKNAIIHSLPEAEKDKYFSLNYKGPDVHVQLKTFADGKKRAIFKVPTELGGDNKYRLFNEPGEWKKDVSGFSADIPIILADLVVGYYSAPGGPNAVAINTGITNAVGEFMRLQIGKDFFNQNTDMSKGDMVKQALAVGGITGVATKAMFPIMNTANRIYQNAKATIGLGEGVLSRKVVRDFVTNYKEGPGKNLDNETLIKELIENATKPKSQGGLGMSLEEAKLLLKEPLAATDGATLAGSASKKILKGDKETGNIGLGVKVGKDAVKAAEKITKSSIETQKKIISEITGIDVTKLSELNMSSDAYKKIALIANERYKSNLIRGQDITEKFQNEWATYSKKYINSLKPEEQNFNKVITDILGNMKANNYAKANNLNAELTTILKNVTVNIPKTNQFQISPSKLITNSLDGINKFLKKNKSLLNEADLEKFNQSKIALNSLKAQLKTNKKMSALEVMDTIESLDTLKTFYPSLTKDFTALQATLRSAMNKAKAAMPDNGKKLLQKQFEFIESKNMLKEGVIGTIINKLGGTSGPIVKFKGMVDNDVFDTLFGNSKAQITALKYIKSGLNGGLQKNNSDTLKIMMHNKYIDFLENGGTTKQFLSKYGNAYKEIFSPKEFRSFLNVTTSKAALEKIISGQLNTSQIAKNVFPMLKNLDISNMNYNTIAKAILNPDATPKQINTFFNSVSKSAGGSEAVKSIKAHYLKGILQQFQMKDPVLGRNTLDGGALFNWLSDVKNEQVFINMFGESAAKNFKLVSAQLNLMQNFDTYLSKNISEKAAAKMRETATRMVYGPLSHENVIIKGVLFFLNGFDNKLGKELFDYDFFIEKFKRSYAAKYAPALNDKKFLKYFNTYDAGTGQKLYTSLNTALGLGVGQEQKGSSLSDTGLPTFDFVDTAAMVDDTILEPIQKNISNALDLIVKGVNESDKKIKKEDTLKKIRELKEDE